MLKGTDDAQRIRARAQEVADLAAESATEDLPALIAAALHAERLRWISKLDGPLDTYTLAVLRKWPTCPLCGTVQDPSDGPSAPAGGA